MFHSPQRVMNLFRSLLLGACVLGLALTGCDTGGADGGDGPPALLAPAAFEFANADFPQAQGRGTQAGANFSNAALRVGTVNLAVGLHLIIPHLVTRAALNAEPVVESETWVWSNTVRIHEEDATFALAGTPDGDGVEWAMQITTRSPIDGEVLDDFELYTAQTAFDGRSGDWQLYHEVEGARVRVLEAAFDADAESVRRLAFHVPNGVDEHGGDAVVYERAGTARGFDWTQVAEGNEHLVAWDAVSHAGSIQATNYNGGVRACWNFNLEDAPCP